VAAAMVAMSLALGLLAVLVVVKDLVSTIFLEEMGCMYTCGIRNLVLARSIAGLNRVWARKLSVIMFFAATTRNWTCTYFRQFPGLCNWDKNMAALAALYTLQLRSLPPRRLLCSLVDNAGAR